VLTACEERDGPVATNATLSEFGGETYADRTLPDYLAEAPGGGQPPPRP
jgi:hypothetical protein